MAIIKRSSGRRKVFSLWLLTIPLLIVGGAKLKQYAEVSIERDVKYGSANGQDLLLDVFHVPAAQDSNRIVIHPAVLIVHGGGWAAGDKRDFDDLGRGLASAGYITFSANYRLVKGKNNPYPAQIDDVQRAVRWIRAHAAQYHLDPQRLGAMGGSAGGHLVSLLGTIETRDNSDKALSTYSSRVSCVVDMNGPADLTVPFPLFAKEDSSNIENVVTNFIGQPRSKVAAYRAASPLFHIDKNTVPFLIFHGDQDSLVPLDQSRRFQKALQDNGTPAELVVFPGEGHGFSKKENIDTLILKTLSFFKQHLSPPTP